MDDLLSSVTKMVNSALSAAGDLGEEAVDAATAAASSAIEHYNKVYKGYLATGMSPEDAADATERYLRQVYGIL